MYVEYHVAGGVAYVGFRVRGGVVEKLEGVCVRFLRAFWLLRGDGTKGSEHGGFDCNGIVEELPHNVLH